jgi:prepilin-type N-terminal cleavage/methylation domain-containing protein/prepilin-type processing-associated H-X9-DG protein
MFRNRAGFTLIELLVVIAIIAILAAILFPVFAQAREKARSAACLSNQKQIGTALMMYGQDFDEGLPCWAEWVMSPPGPNAPSSYWQAKLQPYIKSGNPDANDNTGVWQCPSLGARGEKEAFPDGRVPYSYGYNYYVHRNDPGSVVTGVPHGYRYPSLNEMDAPASTVFAGDGSGDGRLRMPYEFAYWKAVQNKTVGTSGPAPWAGNEIPDRHAGGANYIFADGHAKWLNAEAAFPKPANPSSPTTAEKKKAYTAIANYFAYFAAEREWYRKNGQ